MKPGWLFVPRDTHPYFIFSIEFAIRVELEVEDIKWMKEKTTHVPDDIHPLSSCSVGKRNPD